MRFYGLLISLYLISLPSVASEVTCDDPGDEVTTRVYYLNGLDHHPHQRKRAMEQLNSLLNKDELELRHSIFSINDGLETLIQQYQEQHQNMSMFWSWYHDISSAPEWFQSAFADYMISLDNLSYDTSSNLRALIDGYLNDLYSGIKVVVLAHSSSGFYANNAYSYITQNHPEYINSMGIILVGPATDEVIALGGWVSNSQDSVLQTIGAFYSVLPSTFSNSFELDPLGHNFVNTYLASQGEEIKEQVIDLESELEQPRKHPDCGKSAKVETIQARGTQSNTIIWGIRIIEGTKIAIKLIGSNFKENVICKFDEDENRFERSAPDSVLIEHAIPTNHPYWYRACGLGRDRVISSGQLYNVSLPSN